MTETDWSKLRNHDVFKKGIDQWKYLWDLLEYLNGSRIIRHESTNLSVWAAIAMLRNNQLRINANIQQLNKKNDEIKDEIFSIYSSINALEDMIISVRKYVENRVDIADDYLLDGVESSVTPRTRPTPQSGQAAGQQTSEGGLNSGLNLTERQQEIFSLKKQKKTNREIAEYLGISEPRVTQIIQSLQKKGMLP